MRASTASRQPSQRRWELVGSKDITTFTDLLWRHRRSGRLRATTLPGRWTWDVLQAAKINTTATTEETTDA